MRNPWLDVPAADYEAHMQSPEVGQASMLSRLLGEALARVRPRDLLLLGCATGNGLPLVDARVTRRVVAVDIHAGYLAELRRRHPHPAFELQVDCADVTGYAFPDARFDLVHCALLLEYVDWPQLLPSFAGTLRRGGVLHVVLQRPSADVPVVTPTRYTSLRGLEAIFRFVEPGELAAHAQAQGLVLESQRIEALQSGKRFVVLYLRKPAA